MSIVPSSYHVHSYSNVLLYGFLTFFCIVLLHYLISLLCCSPSEYPPKIINFFTCSISPLPPPWIFPGLSSSWQEKRWIVPPPPNFRNDWSNHSFNKISHLLSPLHFMSPLLLCFIQSASPHRYQEQRRRSSVWNGPSMALSNFQNCAPFTKTAPSGPHSTAALIWQGRPLVDVWFSSSNAEVRLFNFQISHPDWGS